MALTFLQMQDAAIALGGLGTADRTNIKQFINQSKRDLEARGFAWAWMETVGSIATVANTQFATYPSSTKMILRLRPQGTTLRTPVYTDWNSYEENWGDWSTNISQTGVPAYWSQHGTLVYFYPIPNAIYTYTTETLAYSADLSADGDTSALPDEHEDILIYGALMHQAARDKDWTAVEYFQTMYEGKIKELKMDTRMRQLQTPNKVPMPDSYHGTFG